MHERSLVQNLLKQVGQIVADQGGGRVSEIYVQAGEMSGIEPLLFASAFEEMVADVFSSECRLKLELVPVTAVCTHCQHQFEVVDFQFHCPECQSGSVDVIQGDRLQLMSITMESSDSHEGVSA
ncbi:hydrogenase maturation nickel metallochaperone HypA [Gimesia maris]|uniref:hydrogenase maturation nickel metallochaperone HypA/HybF n=1 Tax=Gimesia maris TaxID=122 RepID=UPI00241C90F6|nr:hydrogenase maturation nickel metallochaperone HypA [Gimesia maris]|tara:strand:- start:70991 stop:71362 length:372 start_codon:yes stop_codon:yes gene_type:complete